MQNCILLHLIFSISVEILMFGLLLSGFPESLMLGLMISATLSFSKTSTTQWFFAHLDHIWGPHTVDRFANTFSAHLPRFSSRFRVRAQKLLMLFKSYGQRRIIGSFRQFIL